MKVLSLFSGIGGPELALHALGCETAAYSEIDPYASDVFAKRFPDAVNLGDVRTITADTGAYDVIVGGFPCQDISSAGKGAGIAEGTRSGLWFEYARLIGEVRPKLVLIENVSALLNKGLDRVLWDLAELGYEAEWDCIPAAAVGAPHLRDRIWIAAWPEGTAHSWVFDSTQERSVGTLRNPPTKMPRAGRMEQEALYTRTPIAPRKTRREDGRTYWNGVNLSTAEASLLYPTPSASRYGSNRGGAAGRVGPVRHSLESMARHGLWPSPTASWNANRGLRRCPSAAAGTHGKKLAEEAAEAEVAAGKPRAMLNPAWVEWLMGFPVGWTDLDCDDPVLLGWEVDPADGIDREELWPTCRSTDGDRGGRGDLIQAVRGNRSPSGHYSHVLDGTEVPRFCVVPRTVEGCPSRKDRLTCLGNALVPQVMHFVAARALAAIR